MTRLPVAAACAAMFAAPAFAFAQTEDAGRSYEYGHVRLVEGEAWHQRAEASDANEAEPNNVFLPGDRIWTREAGRIELRLAGWVTIWMEENTKLDYVEGADPHRLGFWTGSVIVALSEDTPVQIETHAGTFDPQGAGVYRLDLHPDERAVQVVVRDGLAALSTDAGSVLVGAGQRSVAAPGHAPSNPEAYNVDDRFQRWSEERLAASGDGGNVEVYDDLPEEVREHSHDLHHHGDWHDDHQHGWVWYPRVAVGWTPYYYGRWAYTPFGYTWVSHDPWGWAPYHYGRWGHGRRGWYWVPSAYWGPGWVSWAYGPDWIGWSPLGYYGRPVYAYPRPGTIRGRAVARGDASARGRGWSFTRRSALGKAASRNRISASRIRTLADARVIERGAVLDRGLTQRATGTTAVSRSAQATTRRLSSSPTAVARSGGSRAASRAARPQRARYTGRQAVSRGAASNAGARSEGRPASGAESRSRGRASAGSSGRSRVEGRATRPPRPGAGSSRAGSTRRPSSVRPRSGSSSGSRPRSTTRSRPRRPSASDASSGSSGSSASRSSAQSSSSRSSSSARSSSSRTRARRPSASSPSSGSSRSSASRSSAQSSSSRSSSSARSSSSRTRARRPSASGSSSGSSRSSASRSSARSSGSRSSSSSARSSSSRSSASRSSARRRPRI